MVQLRPTAKTRRQLRTEKRRLQLESLERRELLAAEIIGTTGLEPHAVFAPDTPQSYIDQWEQEHGNAPVPDGFVGPINLSSSRWTNPTGGVSPEIGDGATISWSFIPDNTLVAGDAAPAGSDLIAFLDGIYGGTGNSTIETKPWFPLFQNVFDEWETNSGLTFVYEPNDDGAAQGGNAVGEIGVRGDIRIGGANIDGNYNTLAYNFIPTGGGNSGVDGDMVIDTADIFYANNSNGAGGENRGLHNVLMHEVGHGLGLLHVEPVNQTKLMEPSVNFSFLGAQHDDKLAIQSLYGDRFSDNNSQANATDLGQVNAASIHATNVSIDSNSDIDWYSFDAEAGELLTLAITPSGEAYSVGAQGGSASDVDSRSNSDLRFELYTPSGDLIVSQNAAAEGEPEYASSIALLESGKYTVGVFGSSSRGANSGENSQTQFYSLTVQQSQLTDPSLIAVAPNNGELFDLDPTDQSSNFRELAPTELTLTFGGTHAIDASTLDAITVQYSESGNFVLDAVDVNIGYIGLDASGRNAIVRFAENLSDGFYQLSVSSELSSVAGIPFLPSSPEPVPGAPLQTREVISFEIELGAKVIAVVAQPIVGGSANLREIDVYFDDADLFRPGSTIANPSFYQLVDTQNTATTEDDVLAMPQSIAVDSVARKVTLTFAADLDAYVDPGDTLRLRVGDNTDFTNINVTRQSIPTDAGLTKTTAAAVTSAATGSWSTVITGQAIRNFGAIQVNPMVDDAGSRSDPGHRDIEIEGHFLSPGSIDGDNSVTTIAYTFLRNTPYGSNSQGDPLFNQMNAEQEKRFLEILDLYSAQLGIDFVETETFGLRLIVGDLSTADPTVVSGPGGTAGLGGPGGVTMDALDFTTSQSNQFGAGFFNVALHEIGHAIGLGHSYELSPGTVQGSTGQYPDPERTGPGTEWAFPSANDIVHGIHLHQRESLDVDLYKVSVAETGILKAQTFAQRLPSASLLDTRLSLYQEDASGKLVLVSANEDYFGADSFIEYSVTAGDYYVGVSSEGNSLFDPNSGLTAAGGTSEGSYELRVDFKSEAATAMVDAAGTRIDGDRDGSQGGIYDFWFEPVDTTTIFVNKLGGTGVGPLGSLTNPYTDIPAALAAAEAAVAANDGVVVRLLPNGGVDADVMTAGDNLAYEIGVIPSINDTLDDGRNLTLPRGVHLVVDAGVIMKFLDARISVGSDDDGNDRSEGSISVQGTPDLPVYFTSYNDTTLGSNSNIFGSAVQRGDWGGIEIRSDVDRLQGRNDLSRQGIFQNYVNHAQFSYGGGEVSTVGRTIDPIHLSDSRPELSYNMIVRSSGAAMSADPNAFEVTTFAEPRFQSFSISGDGFSTDYDRVGPSIFGNLFDENSTNGIFVRIDTPAGGGLETLRVTARFDDTDIVHVLGENLLIDGNAGGPIQVSRRPSPIIGLAVASGGALTAGNYQYSYTFVDQFGFESPGSVVQQINAVAANSQIDLTNIPVASEQYVARRLYRSVGGSPFTLVAELDKSSRDYTDNLTTPAIGAPTMDPTNAAVIHSRPDGTLVVDPGTLIKNRGARIQLGFGATLIAEGIEGKEIVLTARADDRYGAGGTFDTNGNGASVGAPAAWAGIYASPTSRLSIDHTYVAFAGGTTGVNGGTASFNPIQIHQADARIANSVFEDNADGTGVSQGDARRDFAPNAAATIYVTNAQPTFVGNTLINNEGSAFNINVNSMNADFVTDLGRQTGAVAIYETPPANNGPVLRGNRMSGNGVNGVTIRGEVLTTEVVWDDTDIVHVLRNDIEIPDLHTYGGMRMESSSNEALVVKAENAEILATGRSLDIDDRIGGRLIVLGQPGFPVVITALNDATVGAGFSPTGSAQLETVAPTNGPTPGSWQGLKFDSYSHDRNVATAIEREGSVSGLSDSNGDIGVQQDLGLLAANEKSGDENIRLGFTVHGAIAADFDKDLYSFEGVAGTAVWLDIDETDPRLDTVLELIDGNGRVLALSQNSRTESANGALTYTDTTLMRPGHALPMQLDQAAEQNQAGGYRDLFTTNDGDSGMRVILPGTSGTRNTFYVRVRSANLTSSYSTLAGINASLVEGGKTSGGYQLQIRLRETDEHSGSVVRYADLRYATNAIVAIGLPAHSPLAGEMNNPGGVLDLGSFSNTDRAATSISGFADSSPDAYTFTVERDSLQGLNPTDNRLSLMIDVDWADGLTRPNTSAYLFDGTTLIAIGTDSNVSDDRITPIVPGQPSTTKDDSRGSVGSRDAFIGPLELSPLGDYRLVIANPEQVPADMAQFFRSDAANPLARLEPIDSAVRITDDRFDYNPGTGANQTPVPLGPNGPVAVQVGFDDDGSNIIPWQFGDIPLITLREDINNAGEARLSIYNPMTGRHDAVIEEATSNAPLGAAAQSTNGTILGIRNRGNASPQNDANTSTTYSISNEGLVTQVGSTGIQTYEHFLTTGANPVNTNRLDNEGTEFVSMTYYNSPENADRFLYGISNRGAFQGVTVGADTNGNDIVGPGTGVNADNIIFLLDPDTGTAISRRGQNMIGGYESADPLDPRLQNNFNGNNSTASYFPPETPWAGTQIVGQIQIPTNSPATGNPTGNVTSITTSVGDAAKLYAFTDQGAVWEMDIVTGNGGLYSKGDLSVPTANSGLPTLLVDPSVAAPIGGADFITDSDGNRLVFEQVTKGPSNFLDATNDTVGLADMYFGVGRAAGEANSVRRFYAFDLASRTSQPVFTFGADRVAVDGNNAGGEFAGLFFSPLDQSLWHLSDTLRDQEGHGYGEIDDRGPVIGGGSLRFGFDALNDDFNHLSRQDADGVLGGIVSDNSDGNNDLDASDLQGFTGYNFIGGAHGSVQSNNIDLSGFASDDLPTLYFTYLLDSENVNADDDAPNFSDGDLDDVMRDSLRVSVAGEDGVWRLVATNNMDDSIDNRVWHDSRGNVHEYDPVGSNGYTDIGDQRFVQELFDGGTDFRQARIDLGPWAGQENVRIRYEFSTAGEARPDQSEIQAIAGERIIDGHTLTISGDMPDSNFTNVSDPLVTRTKTFEFDHGLVVQMPSGAQIAAGGPVELTRPGGSRIMLLTENSGESLGVQVFASDSAADVADKVASFIGLFATSRSPSNPALVSFDSENMTGNYGFGGLPSQIISKPGIAATSDVAIQIHIGMTDIEVRDVIQQSLAETIRYADVAANLASFPVVGNTNSVRVYDLEVTQNNSSDPLTLINGQNAGVANTPGADFGVYSGGSSLSSLLRAGERSRGLGGDNGIYIDDIVIGLADRGETFSGANQGTTMVDDPYFEALLYDAQRDEDRPIVPEVTRGAYQVEVRLGREYLGDDNDGKDARVGLNERLAEGLNLVINSTGADIVDGDTFTLSNGSETLTFEFNDVTAPALTTAPVSTRVPVNYTISDSQGNIADRIRAAINSTSVRSVLGAQATTQAGKSSDPTDPVILIHGYLAATNLGAIDFTSPQSGRAHITGNLTGGDVVLGIDNGDRNRQRDQGVFIVDSNVISFASGTAIDIVADDIAPGSKVPLEGDRPKPGAPQNLPTLSNEKLVHGAVVQNNLLISNGNGIHLAGNQDADGPNVYSRIVNNTIFNSAIGIDIENNAAPTLLNNVLVGNGIGLRGNNQGPTVIRGTVFDDNGNNFPGISAGTEAIIDPVGPLFVNPSDVNFGLSAGNPNFYPADGSVLIDNSIESQLDRTSIVDVKDSLGIPRSPIVVTQRDLAGQIRDDGSTSSGQSQNVKIDRGALDRSDSVGPVATILVPADNDAEMIDIDRLDTFMQLREGVYNFFEILLNDGSGMGPNEGTITADQIVLLENRRPLLAGNEYTFGYNNSNRTLRLTPAAGIWRQDAVYEIVMRNDFLTLADGTTINPIVDLAGNRLQPNRPDGQTRFTIVMPEVELDFGDAPASYATLFATDGPRHAIIDNATPRLGKYIDSEDDSAGVGSDDIVTAPVVDGNVREAGDGPFIVTTVGTDVQLVLSTLPVIGDNISITAGSETAVFELVETGRSVAVGRIPVEYPAGATVEEISDLLADKMAVELLARNVQATASHVAGTNSITLVPQDDEDGAYIGTGVVDGTTLNGVFLDPNSGDVISFLNPLAPSGSEIFLEVVGSGFVDAWVDYNGDGDFNDLGEQVLSSVAVVNGLNSLVLVAPAVSDVAENPDNFGFTNARFRLSSDGNLSPFGLAFDGEVEDYTVVVAKAAIPVSAADAYTFQEDVTLDQTGVGNGVAANDSDAGVTSIQYEVLESPLHGTLTLDPATGQFTYAPDPDFYGDDSFTYRIAGVQTLGAANYPVRSEVATVSLTVTAVNDVPIAFDDARVTLELSDTNTTSTVTVSKADLLDGALAQDDADLRTSPWDEKEQTLRVVQINVLDATGASVEAIPMVSTFVPTAGVHTIATYVADGLGGFVESGSITVTVAADAAVPGSLDEVVSVQYTPKLQYNEDNPRTGPAPSLDGFTFTIADDGKTTLPDGNLAATQPAPETFTANVSIQVRPQNDSPVAADDTIPSTSLTPGPIEDVDFVIPVSFLLSNDTAGPVDVNRTGSDDENTPVGANDGAVMIVTDMPADPLPANFPAGFQAFPLTTAAGATVSYDSATSSLIYSRSDDFYGVDSFQYTIVDQGFDVAVDGTRTSNPKYHTATVNLTIDPVNDVPSAIDQSFETLEDADITITAADLLGAASGDADAMQSTSPLDETNQVVRISALKLGGTNVNAASAAVGQSYATPHGSVVPNFDLDPLSTNFGFLIDLVYTPSTDFNSDNPLTGGLRTLDTFEFTVTDDGISPLPQGGPDVVNPVQSAVATASILVRPINDAPVAADDTASGDDATWNAYFANLPTPEVAPVPTEDIAFVIPRDFALANDRNARASAGDELDFTNDGDLSIVETTITTAFGATVTFDASGDMLYTPAADRFGMDSFVYTVTDLGIDEDSAGDRAVNSLSHEATIFVNLAAVNDTPLLDPIANEAIVEDTPTLTVALAGIDAGGGPTEIQNLRVTATSSDTALIPDPAVTYTSDDIAGSLTLLPNPDGAGTVTITVTVEDAGLDNDLSTTADNLTMTQTFDVFVAAVNDAPTTSPDLISVGSSRWNAYHGGLGPIPTEDTPLDIARDFLLGNDANGPVTALDELNFTHDAPLTIVQQQITTTLGGTVIFLPNGDLRYFPPLDQSGTDSFEYTVTDTGIDQDPTGVPTVRPLTSTTTVTIEVVPVNDPPLIDPIADVIISEDTTSRIVTFTGVDAGGSETQDLRVTTHSDNPTLINDPAVTYTSDGATGSIDLVPNPNQTGDAIITVFVEDAGLDGDLSTSADNSISSTQFRLRVTALNDAPIASDDSLTATEDTPLVFSQASLLANDRNGPANATDELTGQNDGQLVIQQQTITTALGGSVIFLPGGNLQYTPPTDSFGTDTFEYTILDEGVQEDENGNQIVAPLSDVGTVTIDIIPVNDVPTLNQPNAVTMLEDTVRPVVLTGITAGGGEVQNVRVSATSSNPSLLPDPTINYVSPNVNVQFDLVPNANQFGVSVVTVVVEDAGLDNDFATGGDNLSVTKTFIVRVNAVNDPPTLDPIGDVTIDEDAVGESINLTGITAGISETQLIRVIATSGDTTLAANPTVTYTTPDSGATLTFAPVADRFGTTPITVVVEDAGLDGNFATQGDNQQTTRTFQLTINPINDAPSMDALSDLSLDEDAPEQVVALTGITAGPNENQAIRISATSDNTTLLADPSVDYQSPLDAGSLRFVLNPDQFGTATVTVRIEDGGADNNLATLGDNLTSFQTFVIDVAAVNDAPSITPIADITIDEDSPVQFVSLAGITAGGNETQPLRASVSSDNVNLIPTPHLTLDLFTGAGILDYTPAADGFGSATIVVTLEDGGADQDLDTPSDNGITTETFVINVTPINDDPTLSPIADQTVAEDSGPATVSLGGISNGAGETGPLRVTGVSADTTMISDVSVTYTSPDADATLSFTPGTDQFGTTTITVTVEDGGVDGDLATAADNGTTTQSFDVMITPVNDSPTINQPSDVTINEDSPQQTVALSGIINGGGENGPLRVTATSGNTELIGQPSVSYVSPSTTGTVSFTPLPNGFGSTTIQLTVEDGGLDGDLATTGDNQTTTTSFVVEVLNLDDSPTAVVDTIDTDEDTDIRIPSSALTANDTDPDIGPGSSEQLSLTSVDAISTQGATIRFNPTTGEITYVATSSATLQALAPGESLQDSFTYTITDLDGESPEPVGTVFLNVTGINDAPTVVDDAIAAPEDVTSTTPIIIKPLSNDFDVDGSLDLDSLIITLDPQFGSLAKRTTSTGEVELAYSPFSTFTGADSFRYTISDNLGQQSAQATVSIDPSRLPRTGADVAGGVAGNDIHIDVLANDLPVVGDLDRSTLTVTTQSTGGVATVQPDGTITYVPNVGFTGSDSFQYTVADTAGNVSKPQAVSVQVVNSGLQNPILFGDVNANGEVTALDALLIINRLSRAGGVASIPVGDDERGPDFFDVNGNRQISALDALLVINRIGTQASVIPSGESVGGEGESIPATLSQPIIADLATSRSTAEELAAESSSDADSPWADIHAADSGLIAGKLVSHGSANEVDVDLVDLLAQQADLDDEQEQDESSRNDLALLDLI
ncbi:Matrixin [Rubripirellula lacrimiformis]|uniref:Matrixin n=1 Tax=Rubripirellula lacrimiformis TaxID=1930273 RepID=A0A517NEQ0_9BACT|nr:Ig-like domain-containing protein [Rubripirellula lacrimiformis]QDT05605.1 Matrixin [Rubripirellula lacrimiformis]